MIAKRAQGALSSLRRYLQQTGATKARWEDVAALESELNRLHTFAEKGKAATKAAEKSEKASAKAVAAAEEKLTEALTKIDTHGREMTAVKRDGAQALAGAEKNWAKLRSDYEKRIADADWRHGEDQKKIAHGLEAVTAREREAAARERSIAELQSQVGSLQNEITRLTPFETETHSLRRNKEVLEAELDALRKHPPILERIRDLATGAVGKKP